MSVGSDMMGRGMAGGRARKSSGGSPAALAAGWIIFLLVIAGGAGWLYYKDRADSSLEGTKRPVVRMTLAQTTAAPAAAPAPALEAAAIGSLSPAPDAALIENIAVGTVPKIGADGRTPWRVYARPFPAADTRPRVAMVVTDLGLAAAPTDYAINVLPPDVTLAFSPYARDVAGLMERARRAGHETLFSVAMEPLNYPEEDPGPATLLASLQPVDNVARLDWVMAHGAGFTGVIGSAGSRFTASTVTMMPVLDELRKRGLLYVDPRSSPHTVNGRLARDMGVPRALADRTIDGDHSTIDQRLNEVEGLARGNGAALVVAPPFPATLERLAAWTTVLEKRGVALAPVSAMVNIQPD